MRRPLVWGESSEWVFSIHNTDGPEKTWARIMMDQNNYGPFGDLNFYGPIFLVHIFSKDGILFYFFFHRCERKWNSVFQKKNYPVTKHFGSKLYHRLLLVNTNRKYFIWCFPGGMHFTNFQFNSQLFTTIHNFSLPFFLSLVKLLNAGICISGIRPASGGVNLPKWTSSRHFRTSHSTQVHRYTTSRSIL